MPPLVGVPMRRVWAAAALVLGIVGCSGRNQVRQVGGLLSIDPVAVDFGDVALGMEATVAVTLQNVGIVPMNVDHFAQFSSPAFEVHGLPVTLAPGDQAKLAVRYRPPALGEHQLSLELATDSPAEPRADVGLRGHGCAQRAAVRPNRPFGMIASTTITSTGRASVKRSAVMLQNEIEPSAKRPSTVPLAHSAAAPRASRPTSSRPFCRAERGDSGSLANTTR